jgi:pyruvate, water dikinase
MSMNQPVRSTCHRLSKIMIPFVRTLTEAEGVMDLLARHNLPRGENGLQVIMMCELASNAVLAD